MARQHRVYAGRKAVPKRWRFLLRPLFWLDHFVLHKALEFEWVPGAIQGWHYEFCMQLETWDGIWED